MGSDDQVMSQADIDALLSQMSPGDDADGDESSAAPQASATGPAPAKLPPPPPPKAAATAPAPTKLPGPPAAQKTPPPPPKAAAPAALEKAMPAHQKDVSTEVANLQVTVTELARQVNKMAGVMNKITELDMKISNLAASVNMSPEITQELSERIDEIYNFLETLPAERSDPGIQELYECSQCHSRKLVALHVKCTNCGNENWLGWWPRLNQK